MVTITIPREHAEFIRDFLNGWPNNETAAVVSLTATQSWIPLPMASKIVRAALACRDALNRALA
jgi:hypothetical protein